jgi:hypothetical protein
MLLHFTKILNFHTYQLEGRKLPSFLSEKAKFFMETCNFNTTSKAEISNLPFWG